MAVQSGKDLLVKLDMTGTLQFETIAGLRAFIDAASGLRELAVASAAPEIAALVRSRRTSGG